MPEGIPTARMAVYERLFINTQSALLEKGFPLLRSLLGPDRWNELMRRWLQTHQSREPLFPRLGEEFVHWLADLPFPPHWPEPPDLLAELAHYERVETSLFLHHDVAHWTGWSPLAWPLAYRWPVHRWPIDPLSGNTPVTQPTLLLAFRDAEGLVRWEVLSPAAWHLATALQQGEPLQEALARLTAGAPDDPAAEVLARWRALDLWRD